MRLVLGTNVLVSAFLWQDHGLFPLGAEPARANERLAFSEFDSAASYY